MSSYYGNSFKEEDLISNPMTRVPVCFCLDTSGSMGGDPIKELNKGVQEFIKAIQDDEVARYAAEICAVTFGNNGVQCLYNFGSVDRPNCATQLTAGGNTPMGEALIMALNKLEARKQEYQNAGVDYFQPWLVLMTDGTPYGGSQAALDEAIQRASNLQRQKKLAIFPIGIGPSADMQVLQQVSPMRQALQLKGLNFTEFFLWLSSSVSRTSTSLPGEEVPLDISGIQSWGTL